MASTLQLKRDGAELLAGALADHLPTLEGALGGLPGNEAGVRLRGAGLLSTLAAADGAIGKLAAVRLGTDTRAVRAILFDKTALTNWSLGWHQDRTIAVKARYDVPGYGPWTKKRGMVHVAPPAQLLARMLTLRVHLDAVTAGNAPLLIAPGSHLLGRVAEADIAEVAERHGTRVCLPDRGDVWIYSTPILHASGRAIQPTRRRVLQIDYCAEPLPGRLEWFGV